MSCEACMEAREKAKDFQVFYRWKNANVILIACEKHVNEIIEALNRAQKKAIKEMLDS